MLKSLPRNSHTIGKEMIYIEREFCVGKLKCRVGKWIWWSGIIGYGEWVYCGSWDYWDYGDGELWIGFGLGQRGLRSCWDSKASPATLIAFSLVIRRRLGWPSGKQDCSPWPSLMILLHVPLLPLIPPSTNMVLLVSIFLSSNSDLFYHYFIWLLFV